MPLRIGSIIYGGCGGLFDDLWTDESRVEAMGADWIVVRAGNGNPYFTHATPEELEEYTAKPKDWGF